MNKMEMLQGYKAVYGDTNEEIVCVFSPGRVNLIGEHTDYNGGHVFPAALTFGTYYAAAKRDDRKICIFSENFKETGVVESSLDTLDYDETKGFGNYPLGVIWTFAKNNMVPDTGMNIWLYGTIPAGAGLSSSASVEVGMALLLMKLYGYDLNRTEVAKLCQYSENNYNGMNCGIMDQFAAANGLKDHAIYLDTATLEFELAPVKLDGMKLVITNTNKKHKLVGSAYNDRRRECDEAKKMLQTVVDIKELGELDEAAFDAHADVLSDDIHFRRAHHAVYENQRTIKAVKLLKENDIDGFGQLMNASHVSLRDDFEVSCEELDILAEEAWKIDGVVGSRMTGGGFGGCTVSIVKDEAVEEFKEKVGKIYQEKVGYACDFYVADIGDGAYYM